MLQALTGVLPVAEPAVAEMVGKQRTLLWSRSRAAERYVPSGNRVFIGYAPTNGDLPGQLADQPLANGTLIDLDEVTRVRPVGVKNVFFVDGGSDVSDSALLLAALENGKPSPHRVALLAAFSGMVGRFTLFPGVKRIPVLHETVVRSERLSLERLTAPDVVHSEASLLARLVDIIPPDPKAGLALSGGYDSRLVLGLLLRASRDVNAVHQRNNAAEVALVEGLAKATSTKLSVVDNTSRTIVRDLPYAIATDCQVRERAGSLSSLAPAMPRGVVVHTGQFADATSKNAWPQAHIGRLRRVDMAVATTDEAILKHPEVVSDFGCFHAALREEIIEELRGQYCPVELATPKAQVGWFYYVNRGVRWSEGLHADLALFNEVVSPLSDLPSLLWGIRTSAWDNAGYERARRLNMLLGVDGGLSYSSGGPPASGNAVSALARRLNSLVRSIRVRRVTTKRWLRDQRARGRSYDVPVGGSALEAMAISVPALDVTAILRRPETTRNSKRAIATAAHACALVTALQAEDPAAQVKVLDAEVASLATQS